jgi:calcium-dependent protein kinase
MGACHEQKADRTRFIIDEDLKIKEEMLQSIQAFTEKRREEQGLVIQRKSNEEEEKVKKEKNSNTKQPTSLPNSNSVVYRNRMTLTEEYEPEGQLGEGGYGQVYLVRHKKMNLLRAMKVIPVKSKTSGEKTDEEIELLRQLDHPNIVKLFEYFSDNDKYYLITEYCKGGDLFDLIKKKKRFSELSAAYIMFQIFRALIYCHNTHHLVHRDIKPENIVVFRKNNALEDLYDVKLIDFGISKIFNKVEKNNDNRIKGSLNYMAPEVLEGKYNEKCDIWSCGVILYILVIGEYPFTGDSKSDIIKKIKKGKYNFPDGFKEKSSNELMELISKCLQVDVSKRISAKDALSDKFFNLYDANEFFIHVTPAFLNKTINNIKKYEIKNILQELCFTYFVHNYPNQDDIILINRVFSKFNTSNDGKMTIDELKKGLMKYLFKGKKSKAAAEKEAITIFKKLDGNNNGFIECEEFIRAGIDKKLIKNKKVLKFMFDFLDKNRNGEISFEELKEVFKREKEDGYNNKEDEKNLIELMKSIDTDLNGQISFEEFYNMMLKLIDGLI